ncbi:DUF4124 domain-containing protein [Parashewanella curva]|uniref:DUF4124 domain-containing protein n=1 Tax=Parashewanella curva TaxID=2338552 RepID=A0A3L8PW57_9GAMM|nr:DUF4124 domain-containing protein [Parashewanella curva]RLV59584.1 DUF4124 domain-containing protein [Parashewanella curva]
MRLLLISVFALCFYSFLSNAAVIYKWVDKDGITHFSEVPPKSVEFVKLYSEDIEPEKIGSVSLSKGKDEAKATESEMIKQQKAQSEEVCKRAKYNLKLLQTHTRLLRKDQKTGESVSITEEERQASIKQEQKRINAFCATK